MMPMVFPRAHRSRDAKRPANLFFCPFLRLPGPHSAGGFNMPTMAGAVNNYLQFFLSLTRNLDGTGNGCYHSKEKRGGTSDTGNFLMNAASK